MGVNKSKATLLLISDDAYVQHLTLQKKDQLLLDLFWLGFITYTLGYAVSQTTYVSWIICQAFQSLGIISMLLAAFSQIQFRFDNFYLRFLYSFYVLWLISIMIRGFTLDYLLIKIMLFDAWFGALLYFAPLLLLFPRNLFFYKRLFDAILVLGLAFLFLTVLFARQIVFADFENLVSRGIVEIFSRTLAIPSAFVLLTFIYHTKKRKLISLVIVAVPILLAIIKARRGLILMSVLPLMIAYVFYLYESKAKTLVVIVTVLIFSVMVGYGLSVYEESAIFSKLKDRGLEDTRSTVEDCFYRDMSTLDWLIGKGLLGQYYCPGIDQGNTSGYRPVIETDYLQTILKGGIVSFVLMLLITLPAAFLGLFRSKNLFAKAAGAWIVLALINMYPSSVNTFTLNYLLVWISVGICYSKAIRDLPDEVLKLYFNPT
ncbi:hypothetical protein [Haliscomenobacter hydrossis]|uniref:O-antigen polymerase n=1 Tax=Haliscomenobacter hydrossis (strain ATCC 27775 / DSM 1100 / LMG 10767 / O) TaxID=760192 RepID=F4KR24_HALH1|nr:hypothetical protein [Haliscomenobacter hydrossis]AEE53262.1 hypothetical protein Halhy_5437 [Haliscomenobacter hydrossis DSM 1100]